MGSRGTYGVSATSTNVTKHVLWHVVGRGGHRPSVAVKDGMSQPFSIWADATRGLGTALGWRGPNQGRRGSAWASYDSAVHESWAPFQRLSSQEALVFVDRDVLVSPIVCRRKQATGASTSTLVITQPRFCWVRFPAVEPAPNPRCILREVQNMLEVGRLAVRGSAIKRARMRTVAGTLEESFQVAGGQRS